MPTIINVPSNEEYSSFEKAIVTDETRSHLLSLYRSMPKLSNYLRKISEKHWRSINAMILGHTIYPFKHDWSQYKVYDINVTERELPNTLLSELYVYNLSRVITLPSYYEKGLLIDVTYRSNFMDTDEVHVLEMIAVDNTGTYYSTDAISVVM